MTKSKFKVFAILITAFMAICAVFAGCLSTADAEEIFNDNAKIAHSTSNTRTSSVESSSKGSYKLSCGSLSGCYVAISSFTVNEKTSANLSFNLTDGKGKVVLVKGDSVYTLTEGSCEGAVDLSKVPEGKYKFKIVGVEAEFTLTLEY